MRISFSQKGDFSNLEDFLRRNKRKSYLKVLEEYGKKGVNALKASTPVDSGLTASSWYYDISEENGQAAINFCNSNVNDGVQIAIILQYGHGTRNGGWVEGRDYINPAIQPIFDQLADSAWREVTR